MEVTKKDIVKVMTNMIDNTRMHIDENTKKGIYSSPAIINMFHSKKGMLKIQKEIIKRQRRKDN